MVSLRGGGTAGGRGRDSSEYEYEPEYNSYNSYTFTDEDGKEVIVPYGESKYYFDTQYHKFKKSPIYEEPLISPEYLIIIIVVVSFGSLLLYDNHKLKMEKKAENYKKSCGSVSITSQVL